MDLKLVDDIASWYGVFQSLYNLWLNSGEYEEYAKENLTNKNSQVNVEGMSVLRSAYKHWYYKEQLYKIDAIQKERHGIGVPVVKLPVGFTSSDLATAHNLGRNLRTNERAHIVLPPLWEIMFAKLEGHVVDAIKSIEHHDKQIEKNVLGSFMDGGGSKDDDQIMFMKATRFIADVVCDVINNYLIPDIHTI